MPETVIGIDLGTTFSCVGVFKNGQVEIIPNEFGKRITPSIVSYGAPRTLIGEDAESGRISNPQNTIYQVKRFMGRKADDEFLGSRSWPFEILADKNGNALFRLTRTTANGDISVSHYPETVSSDILKYLKKLAENYTNESITKAVITVPAQFNQCQREATRKAGERVGLTVLQVVNEPTAAAIAYGHLHKSIDRRTILVYDLGGGTFDVSIVSMHGHDAQVLATSGVDTLGGEDFNRRIYDELCTRISINGGEVEESELLIKCEKMKKELTEKKMASIDIVSNNGGTIPIEITRELFEEICDDLFQETISCIETALKSAGLSAGQLDDIVLVGGSTRIPKVQSILGSYFKDRSLRKDIHPDEAVAYGATLLAHSLSGEDAPVELKLTDVTALTFGIQTTNGEMCPLIPANTKVPFTQAKMFTNPRDYMSQFGLKIYEGERKIAEKNQLLLSFYVPINRKPAGHNRVRVEFAINESGILKVTALDLDTGEESKSIVEYGSISSEDAIKMKADADKWADQDTKELEVSVSKMRLQDSISKARRMARNEQNLGKKNFLESLFNGESNWMKNNDNLPKEFYDARKKNIDDRLKILGQ